MMISQCLLCVSVLVLAVSLTDARKLSQQAILHRDVPEARFAEEAKLNNIPDDQRYGMKRDYNSFGRKIKTSDEPNGSQRVNANGIVGVLSKIICNNSTTADEAAVIANKK